MSRIGIVVAIGALIAGSASVTAIAQQRTSPPRPPAGQQPPAGTYQNSCRGISFDGKILRAQCPKGSGAPVMTSLDVRDCRGDIGNIQGVLSCNKVTGPRPPTPPPLPAGSYQQTCRGISFSGVTLRAQCPTRTGAPVSSSLNVTTCRGRDIANNNGRLTCGPIGGGPRPPVPPRPVPPVPPAPGGFQAIAYTNPNYRGQMLMITGPIADIATKRGFNDNIRSIRIIRGRAEICVDRHYRGRCVRIDRSYTDLNAINMGNRISSIR